MENLKEEESEKLENIPVDPYLRSLRTQDQLFKEKDEMEFENQTSINRARDNQTLENLKIQVQDMLEKNDRLGSTDELPGIDTNLLINNDPSQEKTKTSWTNNLLKKIFGKN